MSKSAKTSRKMSGAAIRKWALHYDAMERAGRLVRRGRMMLAPDHHGNYFKRNGDACCGCGYNQQGTGGKGKEADYGQPPRI